jgi:hypothetical protein
VVSQTGRADPALVVEEGDDRWVSHGEAMMAAADVPALWATLEMRKREPREAHPRQGRPPRP